MSKPKAILPVTTPESQIGSLMESYEALILEAYDYVVKMKVLGFEQPWIRVLSDEFHDPNGAPIPVARIRLEVR